MAYARFGDDCDVYVFAHIGGKYCCCGCRLKINSRDTYLCDTPEEMVTHLVNHLLRGHKVPEYASHRLMEEYDV